MHNIWGPGGPRFLTLKSRTGELFCMTATYDADHRGICTERPSLVEWTPDVDRCRLEAMGWYNNHPEYDRPTVLPPVRRDY